MRFDKDEMRNARIDAGISGEHGPFRNVQKHRQSRFFVSPTLWAHRHEIPTIDSAIYFKHLVSVAGHPHALRRSLDTLRKGAVHG